MDPRDEVAPALVGPYRLLSRLGSGGMGVVHLALGPGDRAVALKLLRPDVALDETGRARFAREVSALRRVRGQHVAEVLDADVTAVRPYVVTRYVPGPRLDEVVERDGPLKRQALRRLAAGLSAALGDIHGAGVVHRDLKPANVLLLDEEPVVIDFGIAREVGDAPLTATGLFVGTPGYLAPEVLAGARLSPAADVFAWGATMVYAATGRPPFGRGPLDVVLSRIVAGDADLDGVPGWAEPLVRAALRREPSARPSADALSTALRALEGLAAAESLSVAGAGTTQFTGAVPAAVPAAAAAAAEVAGRPHPTTRPLTSAVAPTAVAAPVDRAGVPASAPAPAPEPTPAGRAPSAERTRPSRVYRAGQPPVGAPPVMMRSTPMRSAPMRPPPQPASHLHAASVPAAYASSAQPAALPKGHDHDGQRLRRLLVAALVVLVAGLGAQEPAGTAIMLLLVALLLRTVYGSAQARWLRTGRRGHRLGALARNLLDYPWQLLRGSGSLLVQALVGGLLAVGIGLLMIVVTLISYPSSAAAAIAGGAAAALTVAWVVFHGERGAAPRAVGRRIVDTLVRHPAVGIAVLVALLLLDVAILADVVTGPVPEWWSTARSSFATSR